MQFEHEEMEMGHFLEFGPYKTAAEKRKTVPLNFRPSFIYSDTVFLLICDKGIIRQCH